MDTVCPFATATAHACVAGMHGVAVESVAEVKEYGGVAANVSSTVPEPKLIVVVNVFKNVSTWLIEKVAVEVERKLLVTNT